MIKIKKSKLSEYETDHRHFLFDIEISPPHAIVAWKSSEPVHYDDVYWAFDKVGANIVDLFGFPQITQLDEDLYTVTVPIRKDYGSKEDNTLWQSDTPMTESELITKLLELWYHPTDIYDAIHVAEKNYQK